MLNWVLCSLFLSLVLLFLKTNQTWSWKRTLQSRSFHQVIACTKCNLPSFSSEVNPMFWYNDCLSWTGNGWSGDRMGDVTSCLSWAIIKVKLSLSVASLHQQLFITWYTWSGQSSGWPRTIPYDTKLYFLITYIWALVVLFIKVNVNSILLRYIFSSIFKDGLIE